MKHLLHVVRFIPNNDYTIPFSASDTVWCVDSVPVGDDNFVTVYNALDVATDNVNTYRFSCLVSSNFT